MYLKLTLLTALLLVTCSSCDQHPPGHMEPLGSHMSPNFVEETEMFLDPYSFYHNFVEPKWPVVFKGLILETDAYKNWQDDNYLRKKYGKEIIGAENGKKENRSATGEQFTFEEFLNRYKTHDIYMVTDMPEKMKEEWPFPSFMLCGGYTDNIAFINVWFSSGGTKSVLHSDSVENFHCVVSGRKEFIMFQPEYSERIGPEHKTLGYYHLDVTAVNMTQYPNLPEIPWYKATVNAGDCLYLPYKWLHHVDSYGRNMGVNVWWMPFEFRSEECDSVQSRIGFAKISQFPLSPELQIKHFLIEMKRPDGTIHAKDVYKTQKERSTGKQIELKEENIDELFEILLPGCNGMIREIDLRSDKIPLERYRNAMDHVGKLLEGDRAPPPPSDEFLFPDDEAPPPYPYHPPPDFYENGEGGGDGHPHARDEL